MEFCKRGLAISALFLSVSGVSWSAEAPDQKPGLWQMTTQTTSDGTKPDAPDKAQHCVTAETIRSARKLVADIAKSCSKYQTQQAGNKWITDSICAIGATTMTSHAELRMDSDNSFHTETDATYAPPFTKGGSAHDHTVTDSVWLGACSGK